MPTDATKPDRIRQDVVNKIDDILKLLQKLHKEAVPDKLEIIKQRDFLIKLSDHHKSKDATGGYS